MIETLSALFIYLIDINEFLLYSNSQERWKRTTNERTPMCKELYWK